MRFLSLVAHLEEILDENSSGRRRRWQGWRNRRRGRMSRRGVRGIIVIRLVLLLLLLGLIVEMSKSTGNVFRSSSASLPLTPPTLLLRPRHPRRRWRRRRWRRRRLLSFASLSFIRSLVSCHRRWRRRWRLRRSWRSIFCLMNDELIDGNALKVSIFSTSIRPAAVMAVAWTEVFGSLLPAI